MTQINAWSKNWESALAQFHGARPPVPIFHSVRVNFHCVHIMHYLSLLFKVISVWRLLRPIEREANPALSHSHFVKQFLWLARKGEKKKLCLRWAERRQLCGAHTVAFPRKHESPEQVFFTRQSRSTKIKFAQLKISTRTFKNSNNNWILISRKFS